MFGIGWSVKFPFALLSALTTLGCRALTAQKSIHILLLRGSPGADFFGTMMTGLAPWRNTPGDDACSFQTLDLLLCPIVMLEWQSVRLLHRWQAVNGVYVHGAEVSASNVLVVC